MHRASHCRFWEQFTLRSFCTLGIFVSLFYLKKDNGQERKAVPHNFPHVVAEERGAFLTSKQEYMSLIIQLLTHRYGNFKELSLCVCVKQHRLVSCIISYGNDSLSHGPRTINSPVFTIIVTKQNETKMTPRRNWTPKQQCQLFPNNSTRLIMIIHALLLSLENKQPQKVVGLEVKC